jgi:hypothetical protein
MTNVSEIDRLKELWGIEYEDISIDDIGIGRGVADRFREKGCNVNSVNVGSSAIHKDTFSNLKAELYWDLGEWIRREDVRLDKNDNWIQVLWIRYSTTSEKLLKIEPKADLVARTSKSPDYAEALMLTFYKKPFSGII